MTTDDEYGARMRREGFFAFPSKVAMPGGGTLECAGMTMRDWFAGQALMGIASLIGIPEDGPDDLWDGETAKRAYAIADAMLLARTGEAK